MATLDSKELVKSEKREESSTSATSSWWGFLDKVKQQTEAIVNVYKEDIKEFSNTIKNDTKEVIKDPEITSKIGLTGLFGFSQNNTNPEKEKQSVIVDRHQARVLALESELSTYCTEPSDKEDFMSWKKEFNIQSKTDEISRILSDKEKVREAHSRLVPVAVSYSDFWERYYYKIFKLNQENERRAALVKRATNSANSDDDQFSWEEEEEDKKVVISKPEVEEYFQKLEEEVVPAIVDKDLKSDEEVQQKSDEDWIVVKNTDKQLQSLQQPTDQVSTNKTKQTSENQKEDWDDWE